MKINFHNRLALPCLYQTGITLIEAVMASVLVGLIATVGANFVSDSMILSKRSVAQNYNASAARYGVERISREIRELSTAGGPQISVLETQRLVFISGATQTPLQTTEFAYDSTLKAVTFKQGNTAAKTLIENASNLRFDYYSRQGRVTTSASDVHTIAVMLETQNADAPATQSLSRIFIRN